MPPPSPAGPSSTHRTSSDRVSPSSPKQIHWPVMVRTVVVPHGMREAESGKSIMGDWRQSSTASATLVGSTTVQLTELTLGSRLTAAHCGFEGDIVAPEALQFR